MNSPNHVSANFASISGGKIVKEIVITVVIMLSISLVGCAKMNSMSSNLATKLKDMVNREKVVEVTVTNISDSTYLTPILAVGHGSGQGSMFQSGAAESPELQAVAEGGNIKPMAALFAAEGNQIVKNPAEYLLGPGASVKFELSRYSLIAKMLPTHDGFIAVSNGVLREGTQEIYVNDAGTAANDEQITGGDAPNTPGIPADPSGKADVNTLGIAGVVAEGSVGRHPGISGGEGLGLDPEVHGWNGPIATVQVTM